LRNSSEHQRKETVREELKRLPDAKRSVLQGLWRDLYGSDPPEKISHQLLRQAIAHRLQIKHFGGLAFPTRRALNRLLEEPGSVRHRDQKGKVMSSGTVLVRDWHGSTHQVTTTEKGVLYRGKLFRSLSEVAREITGTRWSGPLFFGLRGSARKVRHGVR
jgi:hypothetical protein